MNKRLTLALVAIVAIAGTASVHALGVPILPSWDGEKMTYVPCTYQCFDAVKNSATDGFDPTWLADPVVKQDCQQAHIDLQKSGMPDLPYCNSQFGTL